MSTAATTQSPTAVQNAVKSVEEAVERIVNDAEQTFPAAATFGDAVRQGDVYIQLIPLFTGCPPLYEKVAKPEFPMQLAPGNTKGSRHMLEFSEGIEVYKCKTDALLEMEEAAAAGMVSWQVQWALRAQIAEELQKYAMTVTGEDEAAAHGRVNGRPSKSAQLADEIGRTLSLCGPIFVLKAPTKVTHPEHGDWILPEGSYRIVYQRTILSNNQIGRVFD